VLSFLGVAACISQPSRIPESVAKSQPPSREAIVGLMKAGREAMSQGRLDQAAMLFRRVRDGYAGAPERPEAAALLARALESQGNTSAALTEYRRLMADFPGSPQAELARNKIPELESQTRALPTGSGPVGTYLSGRALEMLDERDLQRIQQSDTNTLVLEVARQRTAGGGGITEAGVYFKSDWAPVIRNSLAPVVASAHQKQLRVWAAVSVRRMDWIDPGLGWSDHRYSIATGEVAATGALDLLHPAVSEYLLGLFIDLAATGVDGILLLGDPPSSAVDGFSPYAMRTYEREMGQRLNVARLRLESSAELQFAPEFWRWIGWKQRAHTKVLVSIMKALRKSYPKLQVAMELHPEVITNPRAALAWYAEDVLDLRRYKIDYIAMPWTARLGASTKSLTENLNGTRLLLFLESSSRKNATALPRGTGLIYKDKQGNDGLTKPQR
jgi:hypothetical protein